ncbi:phage protein [Clostridioides difficile]|nr:phage protein [Clostridioides difficile]
MALGGGTFVTQNKVLPGSYINFISAKRATSSLSDRGIVAMPLELDWGIDEEVFQVTSDDFEKYSVKYFGYDYTHEKLKGLRDLFKNIRLGYFYKLNKGVKASCTIATAKYSGIRGNDLKVTVTTNIDDNAKFDVVILLDNKKVDTQIAKVITDLQDNDYITWKKDATLEASAGLVFTGGTNGEAVTGAEYQAFLDKIESYSFNALGCLATTTEIKSLFVEFTKRMRDKVGAKFQTVLYKKSDADYEGVVSIENKIKDKDLVESSLIYWATGAIAGCDINKSNTNKKYDGEFDVDVNYTQIQLEEALKTGKAVKYGKSLSVKDLIAENNIIDEIEKRLESFGYILKDGDKWLIGFVREKIENIIKLDCNIKTMPIELKEIEVDMIVGEFLFTKKNMGQLDIESINFEAVEKSISEGDTKVDFAIGSGSQTPEQRFDSLIAYLTTYGKNKILTFRCLRW